MPAAVGGYEPLQQTKLLYLTQKTSAGLLEVMFAAIFLFLPQKPSSYKMLQIRLSHCTKPTKTQESCHSNKTWTESYIQKDRILTSKVIKDYLLTHLSDLVCVTVVLALLCEFVPVPAAAVRLPEAAPCCLPCCSRDVEPAVHLCLDRSPVVLPAAGGPAALAPSGGRGWPEVHLRGVLGALMPCSAGLHQVLSHTDADVDGDITRGLRSAQSLPARGAEDSAALQLEVFGAFLPEKIHPSLGDHLFSITSLQHWPNGKLNYWALPEHKPSSSVVLSARTILFHRWVTNVKHKSRKRSKNIPARNQLTMLRLLLFILLVIGNVELNPGPDSNAFILALFMYFLNYYASLLSCDKTGFYPSCLPAVTSQHTFPPTMPGLFLPSPILTDIHPSFSISTSCPVDNSVKKQRQKFHSYKKPTTLCQLGRMKGFKICHLNIRSLAPKLDELKISLAQAKPHIMAISESWLTPAIPDSFFSLPILFNPFCPANCNQLTFCIGL